MTLSDAADDLRIRNAAWLYNRGGHYQLNMVAGGRLVPIRDLSRAEAKTFICAADQTLLHVYPFRRGWTYKQNIAKMQRKRSG